MTTEPARGKHLAHLIDAHAVGHLDAAGTRAADREFERGLAVARDYARRNGGIGGSDDQMRALEYPLTAWIAHQRLCHLEDRLTEKHRAALESIEGWRWTHPRRPGQ
ncbi:MAG: helicase associated domain-containing protein [Frankia sp.]